MKVYKSFIKKPIFIPKWLLLLLLLTGILFQNAAGQSSSAFGDLQILMEVDAAGYVPVNDGHSFQFFPLNANGQSHDYMFQWDFGDGVVSLEAFPIMTFDSRPPRSVTLRVTAIKETDDPTDKERIVVPRLENCMVTDSFTQDLNLKRGDVARAEYLPKVEIIGSDFKPVPSNCVNYIIKVDLPTACKYTSVIRITGGLRSSDLGVPSALDQVTIKHIRLSPGMEVMRQQGGNVNIAIDGDRGATYYALLECEIGDAASLTDSVCWKVDATFEPVRHAAACGVQVLHETFSDQLAGSLDPSEIFSLNAPRIKTGEIAKWHIQIQNDGNSPEGAISVIDTLPRVFDLARLETTKVLWNKQEIIVSPTIVPGTRIVRWILNKPQSPLQSQQIADLYFEVPVTGSWDCPDHCKLGCPDVPKSAIAHSVSVTFSNEQFQGQRVSHKITTNDLALECMTAKIPKIITGKLHRHCLLKILAGAAFIGVATLVVVKLNKEKNWW
jgi:uncharacterized repeat protein (TIGR01451 family)